MRLGQFATNSRLSTLYTRQELWKCAFVFSLLMHSLQAIATQPPPPQEFSLLVNTSGTNCGIVAIIDPIQEWAEELEYVFPQGTTIELDQTCSCPCADRFVHWESNEPELHGKTGNHNLSDQPIFQINCDTVATATYVEKLPKVVNFGFHNDQFDYGLLLNYEWDSSNQEEELAGVIIEIVAWDTKVSTEEAISFFCSGQIESIATVNPPAAWAGVSGWPASLPRLYPGSSETDASSGESFDIHSGECRPPDCTDCSYSQKQWYFHTLRGEVVGGPYIITRSLKVINGVANYTISKHSPGPWTLQNAPTCTTPP